MDSFRYHIRSLPLLAGLLLAACQGEIGEPPPAAEGAVPDVPVEAPQGEHEHPMTVDWKTVEDFPRLVDSAQTVVRGRVVEQRWETKKLFPWSEEKGRYLTAEEAGEEVTEVPYTISTIEVGDVLLDREGSPGLDGAMLRASSIVEVAELGGRLSCGCIVHPEDKPVLEPSEDAYLFLAPAAGASGRYHVVGGWQGRFRVQEGAVRALAADAKPAAREFARFEAVDVQAFADEVRVLAHR